MIGHKKKTAAAIFCLGAMLLSPQAHAQTGATVTPGGTTAVTPSANQSSKFFPPDNCKGGSIYILSWDGKHNVTCWPVNVCSAGQGLVFNGSGFDCQDTLAAAALNAQTLSKTVDPLNNTTVKN